MNATRIIESPNDHATAQQNGLKFPEPRRFDAFYDPHRRDYLIENSRGGYVRVTETNLRRFLRGAGFSTKDRDGEPLTPIEREIMRMQRECDIEYAGPLAGYRKGLYESGGKRILVTDSPVLITPVPGRCVILDGILTNMLGDQKVYLLGWLKIGYEALRDGKRRPGQVVCIAGEPDCGKSLVQNVVTYVLGGRSAKPIRYMSGRTEFNWELFGAEHLMIEDDIASTDIRKRREFGSMIKDLTVNEVQSCHGKNRDAISLTPLWRVTITVNNEPENLMVIPPLDESLTDKLMLLKATKHPMPINTTSQDGRDRLWAAITSELPAFVHKLTGFEIPKHLTSERFGIVHYHHPELLDAINELSPEFRLLTLIDNPALALFSCSTHWRGTAEELKQKLLECGQTRNDAQELLHWSNAVGSYLGRLAKKCPERVHEARTSKIRDWTVYPPPQ